MTSARTVLGPLITPFTYPASCSVAIQDCSTCTYGWQGQSCGTNAFNTQGVQDNLDCWPPRSNTDLSTGVAVNGWGFYSPGLQCPIGYSTACSATGSVASGFQFQFGLLRSETAVGCCPTGYTCYFSKNSAQTCYKYYTSGSYPTVQCSAGTSNKYSFVTVPQTVTATVSPTGTSSATTSVIVMTRMLIMAPLIQINWQATDLTSSINTTTLTGGSLAETTLPTASPATATPSESAQSSGLSQGAVVGIGVGIGAVGLILIGCLVWWLRKRALAKAMPTLPPNYDYKPAELNDTPYVSEAPNERDAHEVDAGPKDAPARYSNAVELAG